MQELFFNETQLAQRWGMSPRTLQRWRIEGRGPRYLKLCKKVAYPIEDVLDFEDRSTHISTSERAATVAPFGEDLLSAKQVARATNLPYYLFCNPRIRAQLKVPHTKLNTQLRFSLVDVQNWADGWRKRWYEAGAPDRFVNSAIPVKATVIFGGRHDKA